jgi:glucokinase
LAEIGSAPGGGLHFALATVKKKLHFISTGTRRTSSGSGPNEIENEMNGQKTFAIGIDLGGTKLDVALVDNEGSVGSSLRMKTRVADGPAEIESDMIHAIESLMAGAYCLPVGIGIGIAGQVDELTGSIDLSPNLGWRGVPLRADLEKMLKMPTVITNDVRAIALGEWTFGAGRGSSDVVCLFVGTGIGGGVVSGGRILTGCTNTAGEIGHMTIDINGPLCTCGNRGCLEALSGGWAIAVQARDAVQQNPDDGKRLLELANGSLDGITAETVAIASRDGDPLSRSIMETACRALIAGSVSLVNAFNPCRLILGGGVIDGVPELVDRVREGVYRLALPTAVRQLDITTGSLGSKAGVVGAASVVFRAFADTDVKT